MFRSRIAARIGGLCLMAALALSTNAMSQTRPPPSNPCCTPWNGTALYNSLYAQSSGSIGAPYRLWFVPTAALNAQMRAYINYVITLPGLAGASPIQVSFQMLDAGNVIGTPTAGVPMTPPIPILNASWTPTSGATIFPLIGSAPPFPLVVNHWYRVKTSVFLNHGLHFFDDKCRDGWVLFGIWTAHSLMAPGGSASTLEIRTDDGQTIHKNVTSAAPTQER